MNFSINFIKGILIGIGAILPGVSSGVICVVCGIYEKLLDSILGFFKSVKENIKFLLPIFFGIAIGAVLFSNILIYAFNTIPIPTKSLFIGLIFGSMLPLYKENITFNYKKDFLKYMILTICFIIGIFLIFLEKKIALQNTSLSNNINFYYLLLSGFLMSIGIVVPGISSTIILMLLGVYSTYLNAISTINISILFPILLGILIGSIICMITIKFLFKKFYKETIFGIIGFSLGSLFVLYPGYNFDITSILSVVILIFGIVIGKKIK